MAGGQPARDVLAEAAATGELDLEPAGLTPDTAAQLLIASARGLEPGTSSPAAYRRQLSTLARVMIAGLTSRHPADRLWGSARRSNEVNLGFHHVRAT
jgi:hypothetical protein